MALRAGAPSQSKRSCVICDLKQALNVFLISNTSGNFSNVQALHSVLTALSEFALALNMFLISDTLGNFTSDRVRGAQYLWQPR